MRRPPLGQRIDAPRYAFTALVGDPPTQTFYPRSVSRVQCHAWTALFRKHRGHRGIKALMRKMERKAKGYNDVEYAAWHATSCRIYSTEEFRRFGKGMPEPVGHSSIGGRPRGKKDD